MKVNLENLSLGERMALGGFVNGTAAFTAFLVPPADTRAGLIGLSATAVGIGVVYVAEKTGVSEKLFKMVTRRKGK